MDATCAIQASIHVFSLVRKYVSRILGTYQLWTGNSGILLSDTMCFTGKYGRRHILFQESVHHPQ